MIPKEAFDPIIAELRRRPLEFNAYRDTAGEGRSQAFGLVNRRCLPPDYSRQCWKRPYLYKLLLDFGKEYVKIPYNAITLNQNYRADKHRDKNNIGESFLVAFGSYSGGDLLIHEGDLSGNHNIWCNPLITDFSKVLHSVDVFGGERYSLVYYQLTSNRMPTEVPPPTVVEVEGKWVFKRGDEVITKGLAHPLRGRTREEILATAAEKKGKLS
jgi:hypothetical protein